MTCFCYMTRSIIHYVHDHDLFLSLYFDYILLDLLFSSNVANNLVCVRSNIVWNRWKSTLKPKLKNKNVNAVYFYLSAVIFESVARTFVYD